MKRRMVLVLATGLLLGGVSAAADITDWLGPLIQHGVLKLAEVGVVQGVVQLNDYTHDPFTGALLYILPGHHFRELHAQAEETQSMVIDLQNQVAGLEANLNKEYTQIVDLQAAAAYRGAVGPLLNDWLSLRDLDRQYSNVVMIVNTCYTNQSVWTNGIYVTNRVPTDLLRPEDQGTIDLFVASLNSLPKSPHDIITDIEAATVQNTGITNVYNLYIAVRLREGWK